MTGADYLYSWHCEMYTSSNFEIEMCRCTVLNRFVIVDYCVELLHLPLITTFPLHFTHFILVMPHLSFINILHSHLFSINPLYGPQGLCHLRSQI